MQWKLRIHHHHHAHTLITYATGAPHVLNTRARTPHNIPAFAAPIPIEENALCSISLRVLLSREPRAVDSAARASFRLINYYRST